jgi:hypothetical protein
MRSGPHLLALSYCNNPPAGILAIGVQSLIVAAARFAPPAVRSGGTVAVAGGDPGTMRLRATGNYVVLTDSFDDRWTATQNGTPLLHVMANGYANAWRVPNPRGGDVVLQFWPQRSFEFGIAVSLGLAAACMVVIALTLLEPLALESRAMPKERTTA